MALNPQEISPVTVCELQQLKFSQLSFDEKVTVKKRGRSTPNILITQPGKSNNKKYIRSFKTVWYQRKSWLCGCEIKNALFCFPCLLFGGDVSWTNDGFRNINKMKEKTEKHEKSKKHIDNVVSLSLLGTTVGKLINTSTSSHSKTTTEVIDEPQEISQLSMKCEIETDDDIGSMDNGTLQLGKPVKIEANGQVITKNDVRVISKDSNNDSTTLGGYSNNNSLGGDITGDIVGQPVIAAVCTLANQTTTSDNNNNNNHHHRQTSDRTDEYDLLGEEVAIRIRQLPTKYARCIVQYNIQRLLFEAALGKYDHPPSGAPPYTLPDNHRFSKTGLLHMHENGRSSCSSAGDISMLKAENS